MFTLYSAGPLNYFLFLTTFSPCLPFYGFADCLLSLTTACCNPSPSIQSDLELGNGFCRVLWFLPQLRTRQSRFSPNRTERDTDRDSKFHCLSSKLSVNVSASRSAHSILSEYGKPCESWRFMVSIHRWHASFTIAANNGVRQNCHHPKIGKMIQ